MLLFYIVLGFLALLGCKFAGKGFYPDGSFSRNVTDSVKGIFIWLVFLSHFAGYVTYTSSLDLAGHKISLLLGQLIVACFLFYSGYGVCEAIQKKGSSYVRSIPKNGVAKILLHFTLAVAVFVLVNLCLGKTFSLKVILLSLIGWESIGNSNWYIFVILVLYLLTWLAFLCIRNHTKLAVTLTTVLTGAFIIFLYFTRWSWWYDTALCYVFGMWISVYKDKIMHFITKNNLIWCLCALASFILFAVLYRTPHGSLIGKGLALLTAPAFCLVITVFLTKIRISNRILVFCGQYLFEIYILQRIPMILLKEWGLANINMYMYFILCIIATVLLALGFRFVTNATDKLLFAPRKPKSDVLG